MEHIKLVDEKQLHSYEIGKLVRSMATPMANAMNNNGVFHLNLSFHYIFFFWSNLPLLWCQCIRSRYLLIVLYFSSFFFRMNFMCTILFGNGQGEHK